MKLLSALTLISCMWTTTLLVAADPFSFRRMQWSTNRLREVRIPPQTFSVQIKVDPDTIDVHPTEDPVRVDFDLHDEGSSSLFGSIEKSSYCEYAPSRLPLPLYCEIVVAVRQRWTVGLFQVPLPAKLSLHLGSTVAHGLGPVSRSSERDCIPGRPGWSPWGPARDDSCEGFRLSSVSSPSFEIPAESYLAYKT